MPLFRIKKKTPKPNPRSRAERQKRQLEFAKKLKERKKSLRDAYNKNPKSNVTIQKRQLEFAKKRRLEMVQKRQDKKEKEMHAIRAGQKLYQAKQKFSNKRSAIAKKASAKLAKMKKSKVPPRPPRKPR